MIYQPKVWLIVAGLLFANAIWHVVGVLKTHKYSPGTATALTLYVPLTISGFVHYVSFEQYPAGIALIWLAVGSSYQFWGNIIHKIRARAH
jgi:hypothetical protein